MTKHVYNDGGRATSKRPKQKNDCAVRAIAIAYGIEYDYAYDILTNMGRECNKGTMGWILIPMLERYAKQLDIPSQSIKVMALGFVFPTGTYLVKIKGHIFALVDGIIHDTFASYQDELVWFIWKPNKAAFQQEHFSL